VKVFYDPEEVAARLGTLGWEASLAETATFFIWGEVVRATQA
jgi:hypothetical protein